MESKLSDAKKVAMLGRLALAWDGQWFLKVYDEYGWDAAARINARVRHAFGRIEMRSILRALGKRRAESLEEGCRILQIYFDLLGPGFQGEFQVDDSHASVTVRRCAALAGARMANLERHDQACIGCPGLFRVYFETLLPGYAVEVETVEQMGYGAEQCRYRLSLSLPD